MFSPELLNEIKRIDPSISGQIDALAQAKRDKDQPIRVAACGMLKAGKSTLLNCLTNHLETEYFRTAVTRETRSNKEYSTEEYIYLDTPGIDADDADDKESFSGVARADVLLIVHNLRTGELHAQELDYIQRIRENTASLDGRLAIVLTNKETMEESHSRISEKVLAQVTDVLKLSPPCFALSNTRYKKGRIENKQGLVQASGFTNLQNFLAERKHHILKASLKARDSQIKAHHQRLQAAIQSAIKARESKIEAIRDPHKQGLEHLHKGVQRLRQDLHTHLAAHDTI